MNFLTRLPIFIELKAAFAPPANNSGGDWLDGLANALVTMSGHGFDPDACPLPAFPIPPAENRARIPEAPKKAKDVTNEDLLTNEEMMRPNWRYNLHGMTEEQLEQFKQESERKKAVQIDFDEGNTPGDMHGITEREYGEMKAYSPPLTNLVLAAKVKERKAKYTLKEIAEQTGETEQMIRHYSSALHKASLSPASVPRKSRLSSKRSKK